MVPTDATRVARSAGSPANSSAGHSRFSQSPFSDKATKRQYDPKVGVAARCVAFAQEEGLIVRFLTGDRVAVCPPLVIRPDEIDTLFDRLGTALDRTQAWIREQGLTAA